MCPNIAVLSILVCRLFISVFQSLFQYHHPVECQKRQPLYGLFPKAPEPMRILQVALSSAGEVLFNCDLKIENSPNSFVVSLKSY